MPFKKLRKGYSTKVSKVGEVNSRELRPDGRDGLRLRASKENKPGRLRFYRKTQGSVQRNLYIGAILWPGRSGLS